MDINIETLTKNLGEYSAEANNASVAISKGLLPVGLVLLACFFMIELLNWKHFLNRRDKSIPAQLWLEFAFKYLIGFLLIMTAGYILDAIMHISIIITKKVNTIYPPNTYTFTYKSEDYDGWFLNAVLNSVGWLLEKIAKVIVYILIFIRYIDLYFLKALAPIMIGFYYSDEFRPVVMNFFKTFIAYSLLGVTLLLLTVIFGMIVTGDVIKGISNNDDMWTAFLTIIKGFIYVLIITGSTRKIKGIMGVQ